MGAMVCQITSLTIVYSAVYSGADQRKHRNYASLAFVHTVCTRWPVNSPHKWPVTRKMFPFDDVIMWNSWLVTPARWQLNRHPHENCAPSWTRHIWWQGMPFELLTICDGNQMITVMQSFDIFLVGSRSNLLGIKSSCPWFAARWRWCDVTIMAACCGCVPQPIRSSLARCPVRMCWGLSY